ncbi:WD40 repeat-like protein [Suillus fuscotomentosus]|uniref:WD40 repeat-like protein n=1 Tax=Suillus fuscotomentosus TaxID=1912939 RepID=A0AAD4DXW4_9AGAM|nr:WD40 repeat-like protein [Suillus fuscotomentosus]KAG1896110.1 WD40 repeat-like protein [Suillus fuscotomentosus]
MKDILGQISRQTLECANFIRDYSDKKSFWKRLGKNVISETNDTIKRYNDVLDALMQNFRDQVTHDVAIYIHHTSEILEFNGMAYADSAGLDTTKQCQPGTRKGILSDIMKWINDSGEDVPRVLWLSGPAGTGKSSIAHTIANSFIGVGGLGSCYCFDQNEKDRHKKVFTTIARDLADRHPEMRRALADAVKNQTALKTTSDVIQQWQKLLIEPLGKLSESPVGPVVIVIDALDESGEVETRSNLLRILSGKLRDQTITHITKLPKNFRIIVTSRPLRDIQNSFAGVQHIRRKSMDDIPLEVAERDICTYISQELEGLPDFGSEKFTALAKKANGLFQWARLACKSIKEPPLSSSSIKFFNDIVSRDGVKREHLLYDMYDLILKQIIPKDEHADPELRQTQLAMFHSVIGQILGTAEPLPLNSLDAMRSHFTDESKYYEVKDIIEHMGSLLSGTTDPSMPIRPLHASFRDFLTDQSHSKEFFVDMPKVQRNLAFASLGVMKDGLSFNICGLKSSYLPNSEDPDLRKRVKTALPLIARWLKGHTGYEDASSAALDVQRFIQVFGGIILHSTSHLYVSALPFSPLNSALSKIFSARFQNSLRVASGRDINWTAVQTVISGYTGGVNSVSFSPWDASTGKPVGEPANSNSITSVSLSPDGTRFATGSKDGTVQLLDAVTGRPVGEPLEGHTDCVRSVSFSPDGTRIVSCSDDETVRLWDAGTGKPVGEPLLGHTSCVISVSFSPDGTRIVSGSIDKTVRLWDAGTGKPVGEPLEGHTELVWSVLFSPGGTRIVTGSKDKTVRPWDAGTGQLVGEPFCGHTGEVKSVSFSPDGTRIVSGSDDKTVRLWDAVTGKPVGEPLKGHTSWVNSVSFSPDGTQHCVWLDRWHYLAVGSRNRAASQ